MTSPALDLLDRLRAIGIGRAALFLDVDGTLHPIVDRPEEVRLPAQMVNILRGLHEASGGALALVSGRGMSDLDRICAPLTLPLAASHGAQWRNGSGEVRQVNTDAGAIEEFITVLDPLQRAHPGLQLERKSMSLAMHYRHAPACEQLVIDTMQALVAAHSATHALQAGKCVLEIVPRGVSKGAAIGRFMQRPPFWGRHPIFIGDDLTDESGFKMVNQLDGLSVKVGDGETLARHRIASVAALQELLGQWSTELQRQALGGAPSDQTRVTT